LYRAVLVVFLAKGRAKVRKGDDGTPSPGHVGEEMAQVKEPARPIEMLKSLTGRVSYKVRQANYRS